MLRARALPSPAPQDGDNAQADKADEPAVSSRRCSIGPAQTRRAVLYDGFGRLRTVGARSPCNLTIQYHHTCAQAGRGDMDWRRGRAGELHLHRRPALAMLTSNDRVRAVQALACALRRVCAVPNCSKNGCSRHNASAVCRDARCPLLKSVGDHSILLSGCIGGEDKQMLLWFDRGADGVAEWFKFPAPAQLTSRISLPDGAVGLLQQLQLHVCCAHMELPARVP